jgi:DNA-binding transcriptional ArsR family regulator
MSNALLLRALYDGPRTMRELRDITGLAESTVRGYLKALRKQKLVRVCDLLRNSNNIPCINVYEWAPDEPSYRVPRASKLTAAQRSKQYRERKRLTLLQTAITGGNAAPGSAPLAYPSNKLAQYVYDSETGSFAPSCDYTAKGTHQDVKAIT